jgi:hypothetical protein
VRIGRNTEYRGVSERRFRSRNRRLDLSTYILKEETAVKLLKFFQERGEMKKREAIQEIDTGIDDVGEKLKNLKKLELRPAHSPVHDH